jgi:hypothetical protein
VATTKQKEATKKSTRPQGAKIPKQSTGMSTSAGDGTSTRAGTSVKAKLPDNVYAFPKERKEPLTDAKHVRSAIARFDQVEGITDAEKDAAWKRIIKSAKKYDVEVHESNWRELGQASKSPSSKKTTMTSSAKKTAASAKRMAAPAKKTTGSAKKPAASVKK